MGPLPKLENSDIETVEFEEAYEDILIDLSESEDLKNIKILSKWVKKVFSYNVPHGKKFRGIMTVLAYKALVGKPFDPKELKKAKILGWCVEILQAACLIADDIMDESEKRRGQPCWYKVPGVGFNAVNDSLMLENIVYSLLEKYFEGKILQKFTKLFRDVTLKTIHGQTIDWRIPTGKSFKNYTWDMYSKAVQYKTSYYTFYLPLMLGFTLAGVEDSMEIEKIKEIVFKLGYIFQVQDDFLDCFGDPLLTGKVGTDIENVKCTWLIVKALEKADENQKIKLNKIYWASPELCDEDKSKKVKKIYKNLDLEQEFKNFEKVEMKCLSEMIANNLSNVKLRCFLLEFVKIILNERKA